MCLPHLPWITAVDDTVKSTYTEENATVTGKQVRERLSARPHGVAGAPPRICPGKGVERGRTMCLPHLPRMITFNDTVEWLGAFMDNSFDCTEENATEKNWAWDCWARRESHWAASRSASLESSWGSARSMRGPPFGALKKKRARPHAPHDSSSNEPSGR